MITLPTLTFVVLTGLISCNSTQKKPRQLSSNYTTDVSLPQTDNADSSMFVPDTKIVAGFSSDTTEQINRILRLITDFDKASENFRLDSFSVFENTTEGCEIIVAHDKSIEYMKFYGTLFGEMGKLEFSFYALNGSHPKLFCAVYHRISYNKPMYEKDMKISERKNSYEIYYDNKIIAALDYKKKKENLSAEELKAKETDTRQFFKDYIEQIKIEK